MSFGGPPGLDYPGSKANRRNSTDSSDRRPPSSTSGDTTNSSGLLRNFSGQNARGETKAKSESGVSMNLQFAKYRRNTLQSRGLLSGRSKTREDSSDSRKRKPEEPLENEPPKKKQNTSKNVNVIGAVRPFSNKWQVRTASGIILERLFETKKAAEDVLRKLQKGTKVPADYKKSTTNSSQPSRESSRIDDDLLEVKVRRTKTKSRGHDEQNKSTKRDQVDQELDDGMISGSASKTRERIIRVRHWKLRMKNLELEKRMKNTEISSLDAMGDVGASPEKQSSSISARLNHKKEEGEIPPATITTIKSRSRKQEETKENKESNEDK